jgi:hypothetical protein
VNAVFRKNLTQRLALNAVALLSRLGQKLFENKTIPYFPLEQAFVLAVSRERDIRRLRIEEAGELVFRGCV